MTSHFAEAMRDKLAALQFNKIISARSYRDTDFLTGLRAIAILMVFFMHAGGAGLESLGSVATFFLRLGKYGVQIFFVISGYTIFSQFYQERYNFRDFILVRLARISLPYFPLLILIYLYLYFGGKQFNTWALQFNDGIFSLRDLLAHLTYLSAFFYQYANSVLGVEWTLGVEVFYYLVFGLLINYRIIKLNWKSFFIWGLVTFAVTLIIKLLAKGSLVNQFALGWWPFAYGYMFLLGGLAYYLRSIKFVSEKIISDSKRLLAANLFFLSSLAIFLLMGLSVLYFKPVYSLVELYFVITTFLAIILFHEHSLLAKILHNRFLMFVGSVSYSFYLIHNLVILHLPLIISPLLTLLINFLISLLLSVLWSLFFEQYLYSIVKKRIKSKAVANVS